MMKIFLASDHAGIDLKKFLCDILVIKNLEFEDLGPNSTESVDYPDYAKKLCAKVLENDQNKGILICGTGLGMSMSANRHRGIRAALCMNSTMAHYARVHNDSNVLCLGARIIGTELAKDILEIYLNTGFEWGRHKKRIEKMDGSLQMKESSINHIDELDLEDDIIKCADELEEIQDNYLDIVNELSDNKKDE